MKLNDQSGTCILILRVKVHKHLVHLFVFSEIFRKHLVHLFVFSEIFQFSYIRRYLGIHPPFHLPRFKEINVA